MHIFDDMVRVDVEVATRHELEIEAGMEGEERQEMVEEADACLDARAATPVE